MPNYICPLCQLPLRTIQRQFSCDNNHSFDIAKENYVNLLPVQFKHSKNPGDSKAMVNARRSFLEQGFYQPLVNKLKELMLQHMPDGNVLDAGCGEGFYTHQHKFDHNSVYGVDIAKEAIKKAAKKYQSCHFSVATLSQLPFNDEYYDWVYSVYAPILEQEFTRIMAPQGFLLTVTPGSKHLIELKEKIYQEAQFHDDEKTPVKALSLVGEFQLNYQMKFTRGVDVLNLLSMTPFAFKASEKVKEILAQTNDFTCTADFKIRLFQKT